MELDLLPDVERLTIGFLVAQPEVQALAAGGVHSEFPKDKTFPLVRVHQFGTLPARNPRWLETSTVQIEAFGGSKNQARQLLETCIATMQARMQGTHDLGIVTDVRFTGLADVPDETFTPAKPRWLCVAQITAHP